MQQTSLNGEHCVRTEAPPDAALNGDATSSNDAPRVVNVTPNVTTATIATESGHWYGKDGTPCYTVKAKDGTERPTTLRDARKIGAVPSVTTVTKIAANDGLQRYFEKQIYEATLRECREFPGLAHEFTDESVRAMYFNAVQAASREHGKTAADKGTALHASIEHFLITGILPTESEHYDHVTNMVGALQFVGIDVHYGEPERSFAHPMGYGGKVDLHSKPQKFLLDFKSKPCIEHGKRYAWDSHVCQLAAYREGLCLPDDTRCFNVFIGIEDAKIVVHEWQPDDIARGWEMFTLMHLLWCLTKGYEPAMKEAK